MVGIVSAIGALMGIERIVGIPGQTLNDGERSLADELQALPLSLGLVLVDK